VRGNEAANVRFERSANETPGHLVEMSDQDANQPRPTTQHINQLTD